MTDQFAHTYCSCETWWSANGPIKLCRMTSHHLRSALRWLDEAKDTASEEAQEQRSYIELELQRRLDITRQMLRQNLSDIEWSLDD